MPANSITVFTVISEKNIIMMNENRERSRHPELYPYLSVPDTWEQLGLRTGLIKVSLALGR